jgi:hypothetical protein
MNTKRRTRELALFFTLGICAGLLFAGPVAAQVSVGISVGFAPPELPVYEQPLCPGEGYIWTPGYWAWDDDYDDYYWVPGTWVLAPEPGYLWTPAYWIFAGDRYEFHDGYWGPRVGFYGGIDYGFGYTGRGYEGGRWEGNRFFYNRTVNNINVTNIHNTYNTTIVNNVNVTRVSYNGGPGGVSARPSAQEEAASRERHVGRVSAQSEQVQAARSNRELRASENRGRPPIAATSRPGAFTGGGAVAAQRGGNYNPPADRGNRGGANANRNDRPNSNSDRPNNDRPNNARPNNDRPNSDRPPNSVVHPRDLPQVQRPDRPNTGNAKADQKYQQQRDKMYRKQDQDHQRMQQKQDQEHQRETQRQQSDARRQQDQARAQQQSQARQQQMEQRHQQQTQQMEQRHQQQQQHMEQRQQPGRMLIRQRSSVRRTEPS